MNTFQVPQLLHELSTHGFERLYDLKSATQEEVSNIYPSDSEERICLCLLESRIHGLNWFRKNTILWRNNSLLWQNASTSYIKAQCTTSVNYLEA